jgi:hypothetical protein
MTERLSGRMRSAEPEALALRMANHFGHKVAVERTGGTTTIHTRFGTIELEPAAGELHVRLDGDEPERLREVAVTHLERFARGAPVDLVWARDG